MLLCAQGPLYACFALYRGVGFRNFFIFVDDGVLISHTIPSLHVQYFLKCFVMCSTVLELKF